MNNTFVVIPAWNEEAVIADVVRSVLSICPKVVVVDDGSADQTGERALLAGARVLRHPFNLGQGAALQTGIDYALRNHADHIVTFDADGQHDVNDILVMRTAMDKAGVDIVLGSRFMGQANQLPRLRKWVLKAAIVFTNLSSGLRLTDTHNGLRLLSREAAQRLRLRQNRMAHASEILDQIAELQISLVEVPVNLSYTAYSTAKGQKTSGLFAILSDLFYGRISK